jgi:hypothetical protein
MVGSAKADWSTSSGEHTMTYVASVQHIPPVKPMTVVGQIHNVPDDVIEVRLNKQLLEVIHNTSHYCVLDNNYQLGTKFTIKIHVINDVIEVYYNDMTTPKGKIPVKSTGCYYKLGNYLQSSVAKGDVASEYSETWVYSVKVEHK